MKRAVTSAFVALLLASPALAQERPAARECSAALERMRTTGADWAAVHCGGALVPMITARLRAARTVRDSLTLDGLAAAASSFRDPRLFRAALDVAGDRRATEGARRMALYAAFGQEQPYTMVWAREPAQPPPARCDTVAGTCTVSAGPGECGLGFAKRGAFMVDRPIPAPMRRELWTLLHRLAADGREPPRLRRLARCQLLAR